MLSSWRDLGRIVFGKRRSGRNNHQLRRKSTLARAADCVVEALENRQMLTITIPSTPATLPVPDVITHDDISGGNQNTRHNTPSVAYDPSNPTDLAAVW